MLDKLNNLKIRTKLIALLLFPVAALLIFAVIGFGERNATAERATVDEDIIAAAAATAELVEAMELEMIQGVVSVSRAGGDPTAARIPEETQAVTDEAIEAFKTANEKLDLTSADTDVTSAYETLEATLTSFTGYRDQPASEWPDQLANYRNATIIHFVDYVQTLAGLTSSPEVVLPLEQLTSLLDYNLQTTALATMAIPTQAEGPGMWSGPEARDTSNQVLVYNQAVDQDKADTVLTRVAGGSSPIKTYFNRNITVPATLDTVMTVDWSTQQAMSGNSFEAPLTEIDFPSAAVPIEEVQVYADQLSGATTDLTDRTSAQIEASRADAVRAARFYVLAGGLGIAIAIAAAIWISRSITQRLNRLTGAADRLSHEQLPRLVDSLKNPAEEDVSYLTSSFSEIDVSGTDEIGQLATAFNRIQGVAVEVATEQAQLLRKGIGDMFINLARRNQGLLDRQIEFIDQLESAEEDPDQLENLFKLDHLATRMRRNAESLLVLAGAEPSRRRGKPVPLADVVRAAVGEVEDFARIDMLQFDEVLVASNAALDIAHLLSELMENATNFSPPDTRVEVVGHRTKAEGYVISVTDHGIGMAPDALAEANDLLARPPLVGLALSRSLGFIVIGRLAARFGIAVRLMPSPSGGTTAMVSLPPSLITDQPRTATEPAALTDRDARPAPTAPAAQAPPAVAERTEPATPPRRRPKTPAGTGAPPVAPPSPAPPSTESIPKRTPRATPPAQPAADNGAPPRAPAPTAPTASEPAPTSPEPVATSSGLTKRVPRSAGAQRAVPGGDGERAATQNRRSPDEVRSMLSRYRSGMQKGRDADESPSPDGLTPKDGG